MLRIGGGEGRNRCSGVRDRCGEEGWGMQRDERGEAKGGREEEEKRREIW